MKTSHSKSRPSIPRPTREKGWRSPKLDVNGKVRHPMKKVYSLEEIDWLNTRSVRAALRSVCKTKKDMEFVHQHRLHRTRLVELLATKFQPRDMSCVYTALAASPPLCQSFSEISQVTNVMTRKDICAKKMSELVDAILAKKEEVAVHVHSDDEEDETLHTPRSVKIKIEKSFSRDDNDLYSDMDEEENEANDDGNEMEPDSYYKSANENDGEDDEDGDTDDERDEEGKGEATQSEDEYEEDNQNNGNSVEDDEEEEDESTDGKNNGDRYETPKKRRYSPRKEKSPHSICVSEGCTLEVDDEEEDGSTNGKDYGERYETPKKRKYIKKKQDSVPSTRGSSQFMKKDNDQKGSMLIKTSASPEKSKKSNVTKQKQAITASPTKKTDMMTSSTKKTDGDCSVVTPESDSGRVKSTRSCGNTKGKVNSSLGNKSDDEDEDDGFNIKALSKLMGSEVKKSVKNTVPVPIDVSPPFVNTTDETVTHAVFLGKAKNYSPYYLKADFLRVLLTMQHDRIEKRRILKAAVRKTLFQLLPGLSQLQRMVCVVTNTQRMIFGSARLNETLLT
eukprot:scaffold77192_cov37-Cyclotella_meneghiniana.AAC.8